MKKTIRILLCFVVMCMSLLHVHACTFMEIFSPTVIIRLLFVSPPINGEWEIVGFMVEFLFHSLMTVLLAWLILGWRDVVKWVIVVVLLGCPLFLVVCPYMLEFSGGLLSDGSCLQEWGHETYGYLWGLRLAFIFGCMQLYVIAAYRVLNVNRCKLVNRLNHLSIDSVMKGFKYGCLVLFVLFMINAFSQVLPFIFPSLEGQYSLGHNLYAVGSPKYIKYRVTNRFIEMWHMFLPSSREPYYIGNMDDIKYDERWVIVRTTNSETGEMRFFIIDKNFSIEAIEANPSKLDSIIQPYRIGPMNLLEFLDETKKKNIQLTF